MSFLQRFTADATNAAQDVYNNWVLGDDAGKSARLTLVLRPTALPLRKSGSIVSSNLRQSRNQTSSASPAPSGARLDLGMTFLEVNGRAYVKSVAPGSPADRAGILPQDAVQYATVFRREWGLLEPTNGQEDASLTVEEEAQDSIATQQILNMEDDGLRISYDELRNVLAEAMDPTQSAFLSPPTSAKRSASSWSGPPIPSNICVPMDAIRTHDGQDENDGDYDPTRPRPNSPFSGECPKPVVFCFRRTRQRKAIHNLGIPSFRLDDECDFASSLVKRLAPTTDMDSPNPDTWDELVHDGTDWLLGSGSMLPPKNGLHLQQSASMASSGIHHHMGGQPTAYAQQQQQQQQHAQNTASHNDNDDSDLAIPLDEMERERANKLAGLRSRMAAEAMRVDRTEDVEAVTIRGMIQKAVGLAFVRASKVVLGVSVHGGSGVVIARLSDGTWSAPSAIGTWGLGLGLQFGLEVAEYIFILQTPEAMEHFRRGGSFTVGGNVGAAVAGIGREAYGAASVGGTCGTTSTVKDDEYDDNDSRDDDYQPQSLAIAPIVAYAKSQGLYVGVSLEGSRIFVRDDINCRTYKFTTGRDVSAHDILSGKVSTPVEAEELYAALHSVEFTHEMSCLPRPPEILRRDSANAWYFDRSTLGPRPNDGPFTFLPSLTKEESDECETFETQFKKFMYGGVSVQRLLPDTEGRSGRTGKERRTFWLMLPEVGSLRLGFVSKLSDGESGTVSNKNSTQRARREDSSRLSGMENDLGTVGSEDVTLDSALHTKDGGSTIGHIRTGNVQLSSKHSVALTDVSVLSQEPLFPVRFKGEDKMEHLRVISIQDVSGTLLLFLANNFREAELLVCGLKLLLERETERLGVRGGLPQSSFGVQRIEGAMSPSAARGYRKIPLNQSQKSSLYKSHYSNSDSESVAVRPVFSQRGKLPEDRRAWGNVPGRNYMRGQAAAFTESANNGYNERGVPRYAHGQQLAQEITKNVRLPLPLPLCRVLLLDSTSPVIKKWELDRGDKHFDKSRWAFPPAAPRELERHASEHQLIASGSMCDAHRTISFDRPRYGALVRLSEMHSVEADDSKQLIFAVTERNPRRGFSIKVRLVLKAYKETSCEASVHAEMRPVGKDMSNQAAVHKAFLLVVDEIKERYSIEGSGLLAGFISVVDNMADGSRSTNSSPSKNFTRPFPRTGPPIEEKKIDQASPTVRTKEPVKESGLVSFEDMLKTGRESPETLPVDRPSTPSLLHQTPNADPTKRVSGKPLYMGDGDGAEEELPNITASKPKEPVLIEVKPLPKIRLSLMPPPREEDEDNSSSGSPVPSKPTRKKKSRSKRAKAMRRSR